MNWRWTVAVAAGGRDCCDGCGHVAAAVRLAAQSNRSQRRRRRDLKSAPCTDSHSIHFRLKLETEPDPHFVSHPPTTALHPIKVSSGPAE